TVGPHQTIDFEQDEAGNGLSTITVGGSLNVNGGSANVFVQVGAITIAKNMNVSFQNSLFSTGSGPTAVPMVNLINLSDQDPGGNVAGVTTIQGNFVYTCGGNSFLDIT